MSLSFILGNLLGRGLISYGVVWLILWAFSKLNWRLAFFRSRRWYSVLAIVLMTLLGMGVAVVRGGGI